MKGMVCHGGYLFEYLLPQMQSKRADSDMTKIENKQI